MEKRKFKVQEKRTSGGPRIYRKWGEWKAGDIVIGKYVAKGIDQYKKPQWVLKVEEAFLKNKKLQAEMIGQNLALNSCGIIDKAFKGSEEEEIAPIKLGQMVQVTYTGTSTITKGKFEGDEAHSMEVDIVTEGDDGEEQSDSSDEEEQEEELDL